MAKILDYQQLPLLVQSAVDSCISSSEIIQKCVWAIPDKFIFGFSNPSSFFSDLGTAYVVTDQKIHEIIVSKKGIVSDYRFLRSWRVKEVLSNHGGISIQDGSDNIRINIEDKNERLEMLQIIRKVL